MGNEKPQKVNTFLVVRDGVKPDWVAIWDTLEITVGRHESQDISVLEADVSRKHCVFRQKGGTYSVEDLGSALGTSVNRAPIKVHELKAGDVIEIGSLKIKFGQSTAPIKPGANVRYASQLKAFDLTGTKANAAAGRTMMAIDLNDSMRGVPPTLPKAAPKARAVSLDGTLEDADAPPDLGASDPTAGRAEVRDLDASLAGFDKGLAPPAQPLAAAAPRSTAPARDRLAQHHGAAPRADRRPAASARARDRRAGRSGRGARGRGGREADPGLSAHAVREGSAQQIARGAVGLSSAADAVGVRDAARRDAHADETFVDHAQLFGGGARQVDQASARERAAVVDPHDHGAAGPDLLDLGAHVERQRAVRGGQRLAAIEALAVRGGAAVEFSAVPRRDADLLVALPLLQRHVVATAHAVRLEAAELRGRGAEVRTGEERPSRSDCEQERREPSCSARALRSILHAFSQPKQIGERYGHRPVAFVIGITNYNMRILRHSTLAVHLQCHRYFDPIA